MWSSSFEFKIGRPITTKKDELISPGLDDDKIRCMVYSREGDQFE